MRWKDTDLHTKKYLNIYFFNFILNLKALFNIELNKNALNFHNNQKENNNSQFILQCKQLKLQNKFHSTFLHNKSSYLMKICKPVVERPSH